MRPGETVILLHPPLPLVGVSIVMERERQQNSQLRVEHAGLDGDVVERHA